MTDSQIAREIMHFAVEYQKNLENRNVLFVYQNRSDKSICFLETDYPSENFLHLMGAKLDMKNVESANEFYNLAVAGDLNPSHFKIDNRRKIMDKLAASEQTMAIHRTAKEFGVYIGNHGQLYTEKLAGNVYACMGFRLIDSKYIPDTNLNKNINVFTKKPHAVILVTLRKERTAEKYAEVTHIKKGLDLSTLALPEAILAKLTVEAKTQLKQEVAQVEKQTEKAALHTADDFTVTRHIGQTFTVTLGDITKEYTLLRGTEKEKEVAENIAKDFDITVDTGMELFDNAAEQNAVEREVAGQMSLQTSEPNVELNHEPELSEM